MESVPASESDPEASYALSETSRLINVLLEKMSPANRQAFTMTYYDEMSNQEAGASLGIPIGTFKSRLSRARQHLMSQAHNFLVPTIRRAPYVPFSPVSNHFRPRAGRPAEISSQEVAFS